MTYANRHPSGTQMFKDISSLLTQHALSQSWAEEKAASEPFKSKAHSCGKGISN